MVRRIRLAIPAVLGGIAAVTVVVAALVALSFPVAVQLQNQALAELRRVTRRRHRDGALEIDPAAAARLRSEWPRSPLVRPRRQRRRGALIAGQQASSGRWL